MSKYLMPFSQDLELVGLGIDEDGTTVHEDLIRIRKDGQMTQIDLISLLPPPLRLISVEKLTESLVLQTNYIEKNPKQFIGWHSRRDFGFNPEYPQSALIATYLFNDNDHDGLFLEELSVSKAIAKIRYYGEYNHSLDAKDILDDLRKLLAFQNGLKESVEDGLRNRLPQSAGLGFQTTYIANEIFNRTCRNSARMMGIPFIQKPFLKQGENFYLLGGSYSRFTSPLRKPEAFVNATNLGNYFSKIRIRFPEARLKRMLSLR